MSYVANIQNYAKLRKWSNYNELHRFDVKTIKATQNSKRYQIAMNLHRFDVQTIKMLSYVANHSKPLNYKSDQNTMTCTETMLNYESDQIGRQNEQNVELRRKTF